MIACLVSAGSFSLSHVLQYVTRCDMTYRQHESSKAVHPHATAVRVDDEWRDALEDDLGYKVEA